MQFTVRNTRYLYLILLSCFLTLSACGQIESEKEKKAQFVKYELRALELRKTGDLQGAIIEQKKAVELAPNDGDPLSVLAGLYTDLYDEGKNTKDLAEAKKLLEKAINIQQNNATYHDMLAGVLQRLEDFDGALKESQETLRLEPDELRNFINVASLQSDVGKIKESRETFEKVLQKNPNYIYGLYHFAELEFKEKNYPKATELFERAIKVKPAEDGSDAKYIEICKQRLAELKKKP
jgi:tetratricopeptide (TPR) repeat protein